MSLNVGMNETLGASVDGIVVVADDGISVVVTFSVSLIERNLAVY